MSLVESLHPVAVVPAARLPVRFLERFIKQHFPARGRGGLRRGSAAEPAKKDQCSEKRDSFPSQSDHFRFSGSRDHFRARIKQYFIRITGRRRRQYPPTG